jgi:hypothetical protein
MSSEDEAPFPPDRALAYARYVLSRNPARLGESDRRQVEFLSSEAGHGMVNILEDWERDVKAHGGVVRTYSMFLLTAHTVALKISGRMLPQRLVEVGMREDPLNDLELVRRHDCMRTVAETQRSTGPPRYTSVGRADAARTTARPPTRLS